MNNINQIYEYEFILVWVESNFLLSKRVAGRSGNGQADGRTRTQTSRRTTNERHAVTQAAWGLDHTI